MLDLVGNPEDRFSQNEAHIMLLVLDICFDVVFFFYFIFLWGGGGGVVIILSSAKIVE